jgi:uncharacterized tellurite resistance protein B-like protein
MQDNEREQRLEKLRNSAEGWVNAQDPGLALGGMIETAFLMAAADGELSGIEQEQLVATIEYIAGERYETDRIRAMLDQLLESLQADGWETRIAAVAGSLTDPEARRNAYRLAAGVSFVDGEVQESEERLFGLLAQAFEIPEKEAEWILTEVRDELFGAPAEGTG